MQKKHLYLSRYMWQIDFFVIDFCHETDRVVSSIGDYVIAEKIGSKIKECKLNTGLTFSKGRKSIIVIGRAESAGQFLNTLVHEISHLSKHIAKRYGIDPHSEEVAYIIGDTLSMLYNTVSRYLCECCRNKVNE